MDWILIVAAALLVLAAVSAGVGLALHLIAPRWPVARRALTAAAVATGLPMSIAFGGFFMDADLGNWSDYTLGLLALVLLTLILGAVVCLPAAWFVSARLGRKGRRSQLEDDHGAEAITAEPTA